ncbi:MAG: FtsX-like permease family protein, partial [Bacteroidales bacterium]|nr:FtsX-like permease family protein [Bacteroidales bacterium]
VLSGIALVILLIACINYMNLSTAMAVNRSREVGIRKVVGASRGGLIQQFIGESFLLSFVAFCFGMLLVDLSVPMFNELTDKSIDINYFSHPLIIPAMILFIIILAVLAGFYPALLLSKFKPVQVLKGLLVEKHNRGGYWLRNILVVFQFSICIVIIIGTMIVNRQLNFMQNKNLGFDNEQLLLLHRARGLGENHKVFKEKLLEFPEIQSVSYSESTPARHHNDQGHHIRGDAQHISPSFFVAWGDYDYLATLVLTIVEGRTFDETRSTDQYTAIINESAARKLVREDGSPIVFDRSPDPAVDSIDYTVIGVVQDFHFAALNHDIDSWILYPLRDDIIYYADYVNIKMNTHEIVKSIGRIEGLWKELSDDYPFDYSFLDDDFNLLFKKEIRARKMFTVFSVFAIIIACLGLLGLAAFTANQKTKQIGIRKTLGSTALQVQLLLSK